MKYSFPNIKTILFLGVILIYSEVSKVSATGWNSKRNPSFRDTIQTVVVDENGTAKIPCSLNYLGDRTVTWVRRRDLHILTVGTFTFTADDRFQVSHNEHSGNWTLIVHYVQQRDTGYYDCQVNTEPKISRPVKLMIKGETKSEHSPPEQSSKVFVANNTAATRDGKLTVEITGPRELYIEEGSLLILSCIVRAAENPPSLVYWYHGNTLIDYNSPRGGVNLKVDQSRGETLASMSVFSVGPGDTGMYSCVPPGSHPATVHVHVQKGDHEAAIQQGGLPDPTPTVAASSDSLSRLFCGSLVCHLLSVSWLLLLLPQWILR